MELKWRRTNFEDPGNMIRCVHRPEDKMLFLIHPLGTRTTAKEEALVLIMQELQHDPILSAFDFLSDPVSETSFKNWIMKHLDQGLANCLFMNTPGYPLVGIDLLYVRNIRDDPGSNKDSGKVYNNFIKYMQTIERCIRYCGRSERKCNYLTSVGVFTSAICRYPNITQEMILYRKKIAHYHRIRVISTPFIGKEMKKFAKENEYKPCKTFHHPQDMMDEVGVDLSHVDIFPIEIMDLFTYKSKKKADAAGNLKADENDKNNDNINNNKDHGNNDENNNN